MELTKGIILKTNNFQENSKVATIITSSNISTYLIRASCLYTSKNYHYSQELSLIEFSTNKSKKKSFDVVTSGREISSYKNIKSNYDKLQCIMELMVLTYKYGVHVNNNENLFNLLLFTLEGIESLNEDNLDLMNYYSIIFKLKFLYLLGIGPNLKRCANCDNKEYIGFSITSGGLICSKCQTIDTLKGDYLEVIINLYYTKIDKITKEYLKTFPKYYYDIDYLISSYYDHYLQVKIKA